VRGAKGTDGGATPFVGPAGTTLLDEATAAKTAWTMAACTVSSFDVATVDVAANIVASVVEAATSSKSISTEVCNEAVVHSK
jgi:predicted signal transduction protein with EAL and GGDEF domain